MLGVYENVHHCISSSVKSKSNPKRNINQLVLLFETSPEEFFKGIQNVFLQGCVEFHKNPQSERILKAIFTALVEIKVKSQLESIETLRLFKSVLDLLIKACESKEKSPRYASVWLLDKILNLNIQELNLPSTVFNKLISIVKELLIDKHSCIRYHAINIAHKCELKIELMKAMQYEPTIEIRKRIIDLVSIDKKSWKALSKRLKDPEAEIRLAVCKKIQENMDYSYCKDVIVITVLDRSPEVRQVAYNLLTGLLKAFGLLKVAEIFELKHNDSKKQKEVYKAFKYICDSIATIDQLAEMISANINHPGNLTMEQLLLLRISIETLKKKSENLLYSLLPSLESLNISSLHPDFPLFYTQSMLKISLCLDLGEEFTRISLTSTLKAMCLSYPLSEPKQKESNQISELYSKLSYEDYYPTTDQDALSGVICCLRYLLKDQETEFCRIVIECINEVRDPLSINEIGEESLILRNKNTLVNEIQRLEQEQQALDDEANRLKGSSIDKDLVHRRKNISNELESLNAELTHLDGQILIILKRALLLSTELLRYSKHGVMDAEVTEIVQTLIYPSLKFKENSINTLAIECLGLFCIDYPQASEDYMYMFQVILQKKNSGLMEFVALKSVFDFLMIQQASDSRAGNSYGSTMVDIVLCYLNSTNQNIKNIVIEGFCKLLILEKTTRPDIIAKLLLIFFDSSSADIPKQLLHVFFTNYPLVSEKNAVNLAEGFILSIELICGNINKQLSGLNLSTINVNKIFSFVFMYLNADYLNLHGKFLKSINFHFYLFHVLAHIVLNKPALSQGKIYPRMLLQLNFISFSRTEASLAYDLLTKLSKVVKDKICINAIKKLIDGLSKVYDRLDKSFAELGSVIEKQFQLICNKISGFLKGYEQTDFSCGRKEDLEDPVEYSSDEISNQRDDLHVEEPIKKIKLEDQ